ncbi:hypothetical protein BIV57_08060 [Mangrovactinospora gilvigrisea]|uniref:Rv2525c-like glycoside hydrolase-like domain-containing protein n=1 Tax=Mangrovactinospora gilvigrisea TaxID=1428644 RepID=A0A1J7BH59_9ACTN|nr:hypothetical protein BIV57_08060 [Mangrovactinospora gilvigrisea]
MQNADAVTRATRAARPARGPALTRALAAQHYRGPAFDACSAPALDTLRAWWGHSPYKAVGIYMGGANRYCSQPRLNAAWVQGARAIGWRLIPVYVGSQAPCLNPKIKQRRIKAGQALAQGRTEALDALRASDRLGLPGIAPLYLDMEAYRKNDPSCTATVQAFAAAWNRTVRAAGHLTGFYSSADSGIRDLVRAARAGRAGPADLPDVLWYAHWDQRDATVGEKAVPDADWQGARIHQYKGNVRETHGGAALTIDVNAVDAPVSR